MAERCACGLVINAHQMAQHLAGQRHRAELRRRGTPTQAPAAAPPDTSATAQVNVPPSNLTTAAASSSIAGTAGAAQRPSTIVRCDVCDILLVDRQAYDAHRKGENHKQALTELAFASSNDSYVRCPICERDVPTARWESHITRDRDHLRRQEFADITAQLQSAELNRNGISILGEGTGIDFGMAEVDTLNGFSTVRMLDVTLTNEVPASLISLARITLSSSSRRDAQGTSFSAVLQGASRFVSHGRPRKVVVTFHQSYVGRYEDSIEFEFDDMHKRERFVILRRVMAVVGFAEDHEFLRATQRGRYVRPLFMPRQPEPKAIRTSRPPTWSKCKWVTEFPQFPIPNELTDLLNVAKQRQNYGIIKQRFLPARFDLGTYGKYFQLLLFLEEWEEGNELSPSNLFGAQLAYEHPRYKLRIPGLTEKKNLVIVGHKVLLMKTGDATETWCEGIAHRIEGEYVTLYIDSKFGMYKRTGKVDVRFQVNRMPYRRRHQAVTLPAGQHLERLLFPGPHHAINLRRVDAAQMEALELVNESLATNPSQLETVTTIVNMPPGSVPFVVFGPPGTGKTVTIVEAILQILKLYPSARVLACAPTNKASDLIALRLTDLGPAHLFRLNALSRLFRDMTRGLDEFSFKNGNNVFAIPELEVLKSYRVVVCTCVSAAVPYALGVKPGWFSHIFIDEAGQAPEPDSVIPIKTLVNETTNVVFAGDPMQLGPVIRSSLARELPLRQSMLERLAKRPVYDLENYTGITIRKLLIHFRSHPAIIGYSNRTFYNSELILRGDEAFTHSMLRSTLLDGLNPQFPVVFHAVSGHDEQETESPSYFNIAEASLVGKYCEQLVDDRKTRLRAADIGVISPYHAQCRKIRALLGRAPANFEDLKVACTEEFQGEERRVIIISTVRSSPVHVMRDIRQRLGFVGDPQRFNVAITRARALLIVVGDPEVLCLDRTWREFLLYVQDNGGWRGQKYQPGDSLDDGSAAGDARRAAEELIERIRSMAIPGTDGWDIPNPASEDDSDDDGFDDRPTILED